MEVFGLPQGGVGKTLVETGFKIPDGALAAEEQPVVFDAAGDQSGVVIKRWLKLLESVFEEREEFSRVLVFEKKRFGLCAMLQRVHAGGEFFGRNGGDHGHRFPRRQSALSDFLS